MTDFAVVRIPDKAWGEPKIARAIGRANDPWGVLSRLRDTPWEALFVEIPFDIFDQALRGRATPLMNTLGLPPLALIRKLPPSYRACRVRKDCINSTPLCVPGKKMPECWEADGVDLVAVEVASAVARFWKEGVPVIVVLPEE